MTRPSSGWGGFPREMMARLRILTDNNWGHFKIAGGLRIRDRFTTYATGQPITSQIPLIPPILHSHIDSLCHHHYKDRYYNNRSIDEVTQQGCGSGSVTAMGGGICVTLWCFVFQAV